MYVNARREKVENILGMSKRTWGIADRKEETEEWTRGVYTTPGDNAAA